MEKSRIVIWALFIMIAVNLALTFFAHVKIESGVLLCSTSHGDYFPCKKEVFFFELFLTFLFLSYGAFFLNLIIPFAITFFILLRRKR